MTKMLYLADCYLAECDATVVASGDGYVVLDQTIFYPEGGGQPTDTGTINGIRVKEVRKKDGEVRHIVEQPIPAGTKVHCVLDWQRRYGHMRYHTAQHVLSAIVIDNWGSSTVGNQLHDDRARQDFQPLAWDDAKAALVKEQFDRIVSESRSVVFRTVTRGQMLAEVDAKRRALFERLPATINEIRLVDIDGVDKCPCAGTHVKNTDELGRLKITSVENKGKETVRLAFVLE